jgi:putative ABC transport system permease protein
MSALGALPVLASLIGMTFLVGLISGSYPAFVLSSFRPVTVLKGAFKNTGHSVILRKILVALQFAVSIALIIGSGIVFQQMNYIKSKNIGYNREQVMYIRFNNATFDNFEPFAEKLSQSPLILSTAASSNVPGRTMGRRGMSPDGIDTDQNWIFSWMNMDDDFIETLGMEIIQGRNFSEEFGTDSSAVILNEAAVKKIGWENPIGQTFGNGRMNVVGVIRDFHFTSMRHQIEPIVIGFQSGASGMMSIKLKAGSISEGVGYIEGAWTEMFPGIPLEYTFLDEEFDQLYRTEENFGSMARGFTFLAILIASMGLFGLASHTVQQRTKEIGIRKVLGATTGGLVIKLSKEFMKIVIISNIIAFPLAYYLMNNWLQEFAYRIELSWGVFLVSGVSAVMIAYLTVLFQSVKASIANPVKSLRYE